MRIGQGPKAKSRMRVVHSKPRANDQGLSDPWCAGGSRSSGWHPLRACVTLEARPPGDNRIGRSCDLKVLAHIAEVFSALFPDGSLERWTRPLFH